MRRAVMMMSMRGLATTRARELPSVSDLVVKLTLVDYKGEQSHVVGRTGQTLMEACQEYGTKVLEDDNSGGGGAVERINSERWTEMIFGEGPQSAQSHVIFPREWYDKLPKPTAKETEVLSRLPAEDRAPTSRLATQIVLTKDLDGMVVQVPDSPPME